MSNKPKKQPYQKHIRITHEILYSHAYISLSWSARSLYMDLRVRTHDYNNGNISAALSQLQLQGWRSPATLAKALKELEAVGLIAKTRQTPGVQNGSRMCNLYRFTDLDVFAQPKVHVAAMKATHDYRRFTSRKEAAGAIDNALGKKRALQNPPINATETVDHQFGNCSSEARQPTSSVALTSTRSNKPLANQRLACAGVQV